MLPKQYQEQLDALVKQQRQTGQATPEMRAESKRLKKISQLQHNAKT